MNTSPQIRPAPRTPNYGIDAPGVLATLLGGGAGCLAVAVLLRLFAGTGWALGGLAVLLFAAGAVLLLLGASMAAYVMKGKYRQRDFMLSRIPWRGDETVLDIGTGRGLLVVGAAKHLSTGKAIGIDLWRAEDLSGNGPEAALQNAESEGVQSRVEIQDGDARQLDFPDRSVDVVLSLYCLHNIEPKEGQVTACQEIARVLKPGGMALVADWVPTHNYAQALAEAGLQVRSSRPYFAVALGFMWMVEATKP